jgi:hypothetical protein
MGKVAADDSHKWVYREAQEKGISLLSPWHGSLDPHPRTWEGQFRAGIQTIALVAVEGGLLQLGSTLKVRDSIFYGSGSSGFCPSDAWKSRFSRQE